MTRLRRSACAWPPAPRPSRGARTARARGHGAARRAAGAGDAPRSARRRRWRGGCARRGLGGAARRRAALDREPCLGVGDGHRRRAVSARSSRSWCDFPIPGSPVTSVTDIRPVAPSAARASGAAPPPRHGRACAPSGGAQTAGADAACIIDGTGAAAASAEPPPPLSPAAARARRQSRALGGTRRRAPCTPSPSSGANAVKTKAGAPSAASSSLALVLGAELVVAEEEDVRPLLLARAHQPRRQVDRGAHHRILTAVGRPHQPAEDIAAVRPIVLAWPAARSASPTSAAVVSARWALSS